MFHTSKSTCVDHTLTHTNPYTIARREKEKKRRNTHTITFIQKLCVDENAEPDDLKFQIEIVFETTFHSPYHSAFVTQTLALAFSSSPFLYGIGFLFVHK